MQRIPEPELMDDPVQAEAYAAADFDEAHSRIVETFDACFADAGVTGEIGAARHRNRFRNRAVAKSKHSP